MRLKGNGPQPKGRGPSVGVDGVLADLDTDTEQVPGEPFRRLLRTSRIVRLEGSQQ